MTDPDPDRPHRPAAWFGGGLVLAVVVVAAWLAFGDPPRTRVVPAREAAVRQPPAAAVPTSTPTVAAVPPESTGSAPPPGYLDVCGTGFVKATDWDNPERLAAWATSVDGARDRWAAGLKSSGDERLRAAGLLLESARPEAASAPTGRAAAVWSAPRSTARDALARLALTTRSPEVYALAWGQCSTAGADDANSACSLLSADQWARLEPDNALAWMSVADRAQARGDRAAAEEAMHRASMAPRVDSRFAYFAGLILQQAPANVPAIEVQELASQVLSLEGMPHMGWYGAVVAECKPDALREPHRAQRCDALATRLWTDGRTFIDWLIAVALGRRLGWPADKLQAMQDERDALASAGAAATGAGSFGCEALRRQADHLVQVGRMGEVAAARSAARAASAP